MEDTSFAKIKRTNLNKFMDDLIIQIRNSKYYLSIIIPVCLSTSIISNKRLIKMTEETSEKMKSCCLAWNIQWTLKKVFGHTTTKITMKV